MTASEYTLRGADDFVRLDNLCHQLLLEFVEWLQQPANGELEAPQAGAAAHAADRYLRDFLVEFMETGPADRDPDLVRRYLGNWYVVQTLEPSHHEVEQIADSLSRLYTFLRHRQIVDANTDTAAQEQLADLAYLRQRLEAFWELSPDGVEDWRAVDDYRRPRRAG